MEAAAKAKSGNTKVLAVTALTSLDQGDLEDLGFQCDIADLVLSRARRSLAAGCDGVVSSGLEVERLRREAPSRSEEHTSELQSLMRISYAVFCLKKKTYIKCTLLTPRNASLRYVLNQIKQINI